MNLRHIKQLPLAKVRPRGPNSVCDRLHARKWDSTRPNSLTC